MKKSVLVIICDPAGGSVPATRPGSSGGATSPEQTTRADAHSQHQCPHKLEGTAKTRPFVGVVSSAGLGDSFT